MILSIIHRDCKPERAKSIQLLSGCLRKEPFRHHSQPFHVEQTIQVHEDAKDYKLNIFNTKLEIIVIIKCI